MDCMTWRKVVQMAVTIGSWHRQPCSTPIALLGQLKVSAKSLSTMAHERHCVLGLSCSNSSSSDALFEVCLALHLQQCIQRGVRGLQQVGGGVRLPGGGARARPGKLQVLEDRGQHRHLLSHRPGHTRPWFAACEGQAHVTAVSATCKLLMLSITFTLMAQTDSRLCRWELQLRACGVAATVPELFMSCCRRCRVGVTIAVAAAAASAGGSPLASRARPSAIACRSSPPSACCR